MGIKQAFSNFRLSIANTLVPPEAWRPLPQVETLPARHEIEFGTAGTEIFSGYISEEYLREIQGRSLAIIVDKMKRSDSNVAMTLRALKLPIKAANWYIEILPNFDKDDPAMVEMAEKQKLLMEKALFEDCNKSFTRLLGEILTMLENGWSLFEVTHKVIFDDPVLGTYNTIKSIAFRSQKTIEQFHVDREGKLISVTQMAFGDTGRTVDMDSEFLMHFAPDQEGDNYEGISILRPMYGNWLRKNAYLKWIASGNEKSAIPTPYLTIPASKANVKEEKNAAREMLVSYTSGSQNWMMLPEGWVLDQFKMDFDPAKMLSCVTYEDQAMVNSILASFLLLGQGANGGSNALGADLSDFFGQTFRSTTDYISEVFQKDIFKKLIAMNFGDEPILVGLKCESLKDDADSTFATTLGTFIDKGVIIPDSALDKFIREKYEYPMEDAETARKTAAVAPVDPANNFNGPTRFSEKKKKTTPELIRTTALDLREIFASQIGAIGTEYVYSLIKNNQDSSEAQAAKVPNQTDLPSYKFYNDIVSYINIEAALDATAQLQKEGIKLSEENKVRLSIISHASKVAKMDEILAKIMDLSSRYSSTSDYMKTKSELNKLRQEFNQVFYQYKNDIPAWKSSKMRSEIEAKVSTLVDTQMGDLKKKLDLQYQSSLRSTDSRKQLEFDLNETRLAFADSSVLASGADIIASQTINETRLQISLDDPEVESYTFVAIDDDRTTEICSELNGRTFAAADPMLARYSPPLHYNCRSYLEINMRSFKNNPEITTTPFAPTEGGLKSITLSEKKIVACSHKH